MKLELTSPSPLWAALSRETFAPPPLKGSHRVDVAIVGGGISGLSTALHLARSGVGVLVLEAGEIGSGASGRNNGQVIPTLTRHDPAAILAAWGPERGERFLRLLEHSADLLFETAAHYGIECDAVRSGWIQPAHTPGRARAAERRAAQWQARGVPAWALSAEEVAARLGTNAYHGGWLHERGGHINPLAFTRGLARAAAQEGATIHAYSPVTALTRDGLDWRLITPMGEVRCERVVLATAAYTSGLWPKLAHSIVPVISYQMATQPLGAAARDILPGNEACSDTRMDLRYFRKDREGRLVSGGALAVQALAGPRLAHLVAKRLEALFPNLPKVHPQYVWGGHIAMTPERLPRLHRGKDGFVAWIGCNGRGLALSMAMGEVVADAVQGMPDQELPVTPVPIQPLPLAPVIAKVARLILPYYRYRDSREIH
jgi:glycine/D-amino acid oxidase-like deaminating enzyme